MQKLFLVIMLSASLSIEASHEAGDVRCQSQTVVETQPAQENAAGIDDLDDYVPRGEIVFRNKKQTLLQKILSKAGCYILPAVLKAQSAYRKTVIRAAALRRTVLTKLGYAQKHDNDSSSKA